MGSSRPSAMASYRRHYLCTCCWLVVDLLSLSHCRMRFVEAVVRPFVRSCDFWSVYKREEEEKKEWRWMALPAGWGLSRSRLCTCLVVVVSTGGGGGPLVFVLFLGRSYPIPIPYLILYINTGHADVLYVESCPSVGDRINSMNHCHPRPSRSLSVPLCSCLIIIKLAY